MANNLVFGLNGRLVEIPQSEVDPSMKLAGYLREVACLKGTKIGCGEGGCGACACIVSRYDAAMDKVVTTSTNSCLKPLVALHGYHVTTVEGIGGPSHKNGFHKLQKRFAQLNASQCGFCTPGFVVSVYSQYAKKEDSTMEDIENSLDGNLCRCTGYRPIMDAAKSFARDSDIKDNFAGEEEVVLPNDQLQVQAEIDAMFSAELKKKNAQPLGVEYFGSGVSYYRPGSVQEVKAYLQDHPTGKIVCSQTSAGVYKTNLPQAKAICDIGYIPELRKNDVALNGVVAGGATPISSFIGTLLRAAEEKGECVAQCFKEVAKVVKKIANVHVRDSGSIAGNLSMCKELGFASDLATPLCAVGASVNVLEIDTSKGVTEDDALLTPYTLYDFLQQPTPEGRISFIVSVTVPFPAAGTFTGCFRTAIRSSNAHAITNGSFLAAVSPTGLIESLTAVYGCVGEFDVPGKNQPKKNVEMSRIVTGRTLGKGIVRELCADFQAGDFVQGEYKNAHRKKLVKAFLVHFLEDVKRRLKGVPIPSEEIGLHSGSQKFVVDSETKVGQPLPRSDGVHHASGSAVYASDVPESRNTLHAAWVTSRIAKGSVKNLRSEVAESMAGVDRFVGAADLPEWAKNKTTSTLVFFGFSGEWPEAQIFADKEIKWYGQPIGLVLADTQAHAVAAANAMRDAAEYNAEEATLTIAQAKAKGQKPVLGRPLVKGTIDTLAENPDLSTVNVDIKMNCQKHFYMETHAVYAEFDDRKTTIWIGHQWPVYINSTVADSLGVPMSDVEVKTYRIGGGFGGKVLPLNAIGAAFASRITGRPIKLHVDRNADMVMQGGRGETESVFNVTYDAEGKIHGVAYEVAKTPGCWADSAAWPVMIAMPRGMFNPYNIPHHKGEYKAYLTNTVPRAAVRGPGEIELSFHQECVIDRLSAELGVHSQVIREKNFTEKGAQLTQEGFVIADEEYTFTEMYDVLMEQKGWRQRVKDSIEHNEDHHLHKKGVAIVPFIYHLATRASSVQMSIFRDGSVIVHHDGVEMGQGLIAKVLQAANQELSSLLPDGQQLDMTLFRSAGCNTHVLPNMGCSGGSTTSESNVAGVINCAATLLGRLKPIVEKVAEDKRGDWKAIIKAATANEVNLCAQANTTNKDGARKEYAQLCWGAAEIDLDVLTGEVKTRRVDIQYDCAKSLNPAVDIGQIEGAFMMGLGYALLEDTKLNAVTGAEEAVGTWDYKPPLCFDVPKEFNIELHHNTKFDRGVMSSKASGEPPLCLATAVTSAVHQAVISARKDAGLGGFFPISMPMTPDKVATACGASIHLD